MPTQLQSESAPPFRRVVCLLVVIIYISLAILGLKSLAIKPKSDGISTREVIHLDGSQRKRLLELVRLNRQPDVLNDRIRQAILDQINQVPAVVQHRVTKGRPLLPEMTHYVLFLPVEVNHHLGISRRRPVRIGVIGDDVIVYHTRDHVVLDVLKGVF